MSEAILPTQAAAREEHQGKGWTLPKVIYAALMVFNLLSFVWLLASGSEIQLHPVIWITRIAAAPLAIYLGKLWKNRGFQILALYTILFFFRCAISNTQDILSAEMSENLLSALWLFAGCYGLGIILNRQQVRTLLLVCTGIWTVATATLSCIGIYAVWTRTTVHLLGDAVAEIYLIARGYASRINIAYSATVTGAVWSLTVLITVLCGISVENKAGKTFFFVLLLPIVVALALTDSRTAFISMAVGVGTMAGSITVMAIQRRKKNQPDSKNWISWAFGFLTVALVSLITLWLIMQITPLFNQIKLQGIIPRAYADGTEKEFISSRGFDGEDMMNGRLDIWSGILNQIRQNPKILLTGTSKISPMRNVSITLAHCHNIYLQILLESGLPGLFLVLSFIVIILVKTVRVLRDPIIPLWIKLLPALIISLLVGDVAECYTWLRSSHCFMNAVLFISAGILSAQSPFHKKDAQGSEVP